MCRDGVAFRELYRANTADLTRGRAFSADCVLSVPGVKVGSIGCVGTLPQYREQGIGLRMVELATLYLKNAGCDKSYVSYTHIERWYQKLGYQVFARFSFIPSSN